jgi:hypothetical protein
MNVVRSTSVRQLILTVAVLALPACATLRGVRDPAQLMGSMNDDAVALYQRGKLADAETMLRQALAHGKKNGLEGAPVMARTYLDLGAVLLARGDRRLATRNIAYALRVQPDIQPEPGVATAAFRKAVTTARTQIRRGRGPAAVAALSLKLSQRPVVTVRPGPVTVASTSTAPAAAASTRHDPGPPAKAGKVAGPAPADSGEPTKSVVSAAPVKASAPAEDEEPDLPATVSEPLYCLMPDEAPPAVQIAVRCVPRPGLTAVRVVLFYRPPGQEGFTTVAMARSPKGWYQGVVPPVSAGKALHYYVEARGSNNKVTTSNGQADSPNVLLIRAGASEGDPRYIGLASAHAREDVEGDDPLTVAAEEHARAEEAARIHRRSGSAFWLGVGMGSGYGWHPSRRLEFHDTLEVENGVALAGTVQVTPEIGRQLGPDYAISVQARLQFIPDSGAGDPLPGAPKHSAFAVFVRGHRFYGLGNAQLFLTGTIGGGEGFRLVVPPDATSGVGRSDTVRGGPVVLGPGAGFIYHFTRHFGWSVEARALLGLPDLAALAELSTGAAVAF